MLHQQTGNSFVCSLSCCYFWTRCWKMLRVFHYTFQMRERGVSWHFLIRIVFFYFAGQNLEVVWLRAEGFWSIACASDISCFVSTYLYDACGCKARVSVFLNQVFSCGVVWKSFIGVKSTVNRHLAKETNKFVLPHFCLDELIFCRIFRFYLISSSDSNIEESYGLQKSAGLWDAKDF